MVDKYVAVSERLHIQSEGRMSEAKKSQDKSTILVAVFCEGDFMGIHKCSTLDHARGFNAGLIAGVEMFDGGRTARAYALPDDEAIMREGANASDVEKALRAAADVRAGKKAKR